MANWHVFDTRGEMVASLKQAITTRLSKVVSEGRRASWAVSGGSTPAPLFAAMQNEPLPWAEIDVALVDERWVPFDNPRSNEAFVATNLIGGNACGVHLVGMKTGARNPNQAVDEVNSRYRNMKQPFDSILLGLGADGHTASLFPGAKGLDKAFDPAADTCVALTAVRSEITGDEIERMSLSAKAIASAPHVVMMITGAEKKRVLESALEANSHLPAGQLHKLKPFDVYWAP